MTLIGDAFHMALEAHKGQTDKAGEPYIAHVVRVADRMNSFEEIAVALLHDVVEDTFVRLGDIEERFGKEIRDAVDAMTKRKDENYDDYIRRVRANKLARVVKRADLQDNLNPSRLSHLSNEDYERLTKKYQAAQLVLY